MIIKDKIAGKEWLQYKYVEDLGEDAPNQFNLDNFLVGSSEGQLRLVRKDGMLVKIANGEPKDVYNFFNNLLPAEKKLDASGVKENHLKYFGTGGHGIIQLTCNNCALGEPYDYGYDLLSKVNRLNLAIPSSSDYSTVLEADLKYGSYPRSILEFSLTDAQSAGVFAALNATYYDSEAGKYKYIPIIHNCISFLTDIYKASYFHGSFIDYLSDTEIMGGGEGRDGIFAYAFFQNQYNVPKFIDPDRSKVREFVTEALGKGFEKNWNELQSEKVNMTLVENSPFMQERIKKIHEFKCDITSKILKDNCEAWDIKLTDAAFSKVLSGCSNDPVYYELYYYYIFEHAANMQQMFVGTPYAKYVNEPINIRDVDSNSYDGAIICKIPEYAKFCNQWGEFSNVFSKAEIIDSIDQCYVVDEDMLDICPQFGVFV